MEGVWDACNPEATSSGVDCVEVVGNGVVISEMDVFVVTLVAVVSIVLVMIRKLFVARLEGTKHQ